MGQIIFWVGKFAPGLQANFHTYFILSPTVYHIPIWGKLEETTLQVGGVKKT